MKRIVYLVISVLVQLIYCTTLIIIFSFCTKGQEMVVRMYTAKEGLPSTYVYDAYQDKLGYLWVCTYDGVSRFDGKYFLNYGLPEGLPDTRTVAGFMDSHLRYWAGTTRGMVEFKGNKFISYPLSDSQNIRWVFKIIETKKGQLWCLTSNGVYQFNLNKWSKIKLYPGYEDYPCRDVIETKDGLYINYGDLLLLKKPDDPWKIIGILKASGYYYNHLSLSAGQIFLSTPEGMYELVNEQLIKMPGELGRLKNTYAYFCDSKKRFWIANGQMGIRLIEPGDSTHYKTIYRPMTNLVPQGISEDNQGNIWFGTSSGLLRISEMGFKIFDMPSLPGKDIHFNVFQPPAGPLIVNDGSLALQTFENGVFTKKILQNKGNTVLPGNELIIDNYAFDNKNRYWYNVRGFALVMQVGNNLYEQSRQMAHLRNDVFDALEVFDVLYDSYRKKILIAIGKKNYPCLFNDTGYSLLTITNNIKVKGNIFHLHQCANGTILFSTDRGIIYSVDKQNICKQQLNEFNTNAPVTKFYNDPSGYVWIIYGGRGLRRYSWQNDSLVFKERITKVNGLSSDNVSALCFDNNNNLWVCDNSNVSVFSKKTDTIINQTYHMVSFFDAEDLKIQDSYGSRMIKDLKGNIWLSSGTHLICFYTGKINYNQPVPSVMIEDIKLNLQETNWSGYVDSLSGIFQLPYGLQLSHENNTLGIYYKGISSSGTDDIKYSYLLEGLGNKWSSPSSDNFVSYVGLPAGNYIFKVKAQLQNTHWSESAIFSFVIKKAFWQTWWFYFLIGIVLAVAIYILFRYRLQQKIKLLEIRNRISQDLHDEIGASISGINLLSQMASEKLENNKLDEASEYLFKVKNYTQDVIEKLSDMVWIFNPQNDSIEKILQRIKSFAISIALSKNIQMHFETDKESELINLTLHERKAVYLISKEAINNIFKYAACANIFYSLHVKGSKYLMQIEDDGKGFTPAENKSGNGLKNMQARAAEIGANLNIQSHPNNGTIIRLEF